MLTIANDHGLSITHVGVSLSRLRDQDKSFRNEQSKVTLLDETDKIKYQMVIVCRYSTLRANGLV